MNEKDLSKVEDRKHSEKMAKNVNAEFSEQLMLIAGVALMILSIWILMELIKWISP
jgi:hypothetical protein